MFSRRSGFQNLMCLSRGLGRYLFRYTWHSRSKQITNVVGLYINMNCSEFGSGSTSVLEGCTVPSRSIDVTSMQRSENLSDSVLLCAILKSNSLACNCNFDNEQFEVQLQSGSWVGWSVACGAHCRPRNFSVIWVWPINFGMLKKPLMSVWQHWI